MEKQVQHQPEEALDDLAEATRDLLKEMEAEWEADWAELGPDRVDEDSNPA